MFRDTSTLDHGATRNEALGRLRMPTCGCCCFYTKVLICYRRIIPIPILWTSLLQSVSSRSQPFSVSQKMPHCALSHFYFVLYLRGIYSPFRVVRLIKPEKERRGTEADQQHFRSVREEASAQTKTPLEQQQVTKRSASPAPPPPPPYHVVRPSRRSLSTTASHSISQSGSETLRTLRQDTRRPNDISLHTLSQESSSAFANSP